MNKKIKQFCERYGLEVNNMPRMAKLMDMK